MQFFAMQIVGGVSFGMLLFLLASGMTLIFGLMRIVNMAHGSYYLVGAYVGLSVVQATHDYWLAALASVVVVALVGVATERLLLHRFTGQELPQILLTFGLFFGLADVTLSIWGGAPTLLPTPALARGSLDVAGIVIPRYRLLVIGVGALVAVGLWRFQRGTLVGTVVRAAVQDAEMVEAIGINVPVVLTVVFALGAALAGFAGVLGGPFLGAYPGADLDVLLLTIVVVVVGGLGSLRGAVVGSLLIGLVHNFAAAYFPQLAMFSIYAPMAIILALRPNGMFGRA